MYQVTEPYYENLKVGGEDKGEEECLHFWEPNEIHIGSIYYRSQPSCKETKKYNKKMKDLHMVYIDLGKNYMKVSREVLWRCLNAKGVSAAYIVMESRHGLEWWEEAQSTFYLKWVCTRDPSLAHFIWLGDGEFTQSMQDEVSWCNNPHCNFLKFVYFNHFSLFVVILHHFMNCENNLHDLQSF